MTTLCSSPRSHGIVVAADVVMCVGGGGIVVGAAIALVVSTPSQLKTHMQLSLIKLSYKQTVF